MTGVLVDGTGVNVGDKAETVKVACFVITGVTVIRSSRLFCSCAIHPTNKIEQKKIIMIFLIVSAFFKKRWFVNRFSLLYDTEGTKINYDILHTRDVLKFRDKSSRSDLVFYQKNSPSPLHNPTRNRYKQGKGRFQANRLQTFP